jgi:hypothetical protein
VVGDSAHQRKDGEENNSKPYRFGSRHANQGSLWSTITMLTYNFLCPITHLINLKTRGDHLGLVPRLRCCGPRVLVLEMAWIVSTAIRAYNWELVL